MQDVPTLPIEEKLVFLNSFCPTCVILPMFPVSSKVRLCVPTAINGHCGFGRRHRDAPPGSILFNFH